MQNQEVLKLFKYLLKKYKIFGPVKESDGVINIKQLKVATEADYSGKIPIESYKRFFLSEQESLFYFRNGRWQLSSQLTDKVALWCLNILDLQAVGLTDLIFTDDIYYQKRRKNSLLIGYSVGAPAAELDYEQFHMEKIDNILEHIPFDIFLEKDNIDQFKIYTGSALGQRIVRAAGILFSERIKFAGMVKEKGPDQIMLKNQKIIEQSLDDPIWLELGKTCTACGKCTAVCPTCFCFELKDQSENSKVIRTRCSSDCFQKDFARVAGDHNFLATSSEKIRFWYEHKFSRIPERYQMPGCVSCLRCHQVCPVDINIIQIWQRLKANYQNNHHD
ncbi:MAG: hypothetical protein COX77_00810 [Candidatus Komeilibacteria bacterium CG_4_10_14_0_2_um_filter_37_10]|uniref:4Fe-4S ferredoxin-type domain-containing protein n=1 Tax=Candidatus Komeilibacteria bacterium CG_4_10_14_0_2_um_filter_37_10 TaxID=1974470 RepID=A0A2M7VG68_9BACT|nr:MAG: hypothetical protein COX77_00810 [Candidatus Komeilibacteria bacterium CG_4_10_14_0_2_um_filter_37_10]PJA94104.1 MAG: hypothetical protein CO133_00740 [Candidatus Komeilibacteria bacterium CG_4_9_14_3_um_filter_37_5]